MATGRRLVYGWAAPNASALLARLGNRSLGTLARRIEGGLDDQLATRSQWTDSIAALAPEEGPDQAPTRNGEDELLTQQGPAGPEQVVADPALDSGTFDLFESATRKLELDPRR